MVDDPDFQCRRFCETADDDYLVALASECGAEAIVSANSTCVRPSVSGGGAHASAGRVSRLGR
jgi:hypothetical protein